MIEAAFWLLVARVALLAVPFPKLARRIGVFVAPDDARVAQVWRGGSDEEARLAAEIGWATVRAAR